MEDCEAKSQDIWIAVDELKRNLDFNMSGDQNIGMELKTLSGLVQKQREQTE